MKLLPVLMLLVPTLLCADDVYLQGGAKFSGQIVKQTETTISLDVGDGIVGIPTARVERIVDGLSPLEEYNARAAKLQPQDANGWRDLGRWAADQGLAKQASYAFHAVLRIDSDDLEARSALGFVHINGVWMTEEQSYRAQGFVKYNDEWMTMAEVQLAQTAEAAEQARQEAEDRADMAHMAAQDAEWQAREAQKQAEEAQREDLGWDPPVYWGGWGYGVNYWPSTASVVHWPANRPVQRPVQRPAARVPR